MLFYSCKNESRTNVLERGVLDLRDIDFDKNSLLSLDGEWEFYWRQFLDSNQTIQNSEDKKYYLKLPGAWNGLEIEGEKISGEGFATLRATILTKKTNSILDFKFPVIPLPYLLFINGEKICANGNPSKAKEENYTDFKSDSCLYFYSGEKIELVLHISNFYHKSGGIWNSILWGSARKIEEAKAHIMIPIFIFFWSLPHHVFLSS